jgi:hypothetical protein
VRRGRQRSGLPCGRQRSGVPRGWQRSGVSTGVGRARGCGDETLPSAEGKVNDKYISHQSGRIGGVHWCREWFPSCYGDCGLPLGRTNPGLNASCYPTSLLSESPSNHFVVDVHSEIFLTGQILWEYDIRHWARTRGIPTAVNWRPCNSSHRCCTGAREPRPVKVPCIDSCRTTMLTRLAPGASAAVECISPCARRETTALSAVGLHASISRGSIQIIRAAVEARQPLASSRSWQMHRWRNSYKRH